ncbi:glycosyltransferase family 2 protein [Gulosibacter chungangensis]|uniref:Glycosyltransferase family 2 protein n=1 Tax=Gulosibacter chungangensis TaxID=979746 RepID=A0A7J5B8K4_9MICO|nr:glycosyltransferase family A protein [Gulosibacter chungangensis]KAB1641005.1 glycosyltransferase family 2 protein [Gulosibacter chungangensis]
MTDSIVVAIATYKRPTELERLIRSILIAADCGPSLSVNIIVVDNDELGSAREVAESFNDSNIEYYVQQIPGIAATRNLAIEKAGEVDFIVFVDDDEFVEPQWLTELIRVQKVTEAELVAGPVKSILPAKSPKFILESGIFDRPERPDGATIMEAGSGNLLCSYRVFQTRSKSEWFSNEFGLTGGSDAELTRRLHREGNRIVWASNAVAWEYVEPQRVSLGWLSKRYRRVGGVDYRLSPGSFGRRIRGITSGAARIISGALQVSIDAVLKRQLNASGFRRLFRGVGYIEAATRGGFVEYKRSK